MAPKSKVSERFPAPDVFFGTSADLPRIVEIDLARIVPNPDQPRRSFDEAKLRELADSIAERGLIHPITVRKAEGDGYVIVAGERRFRAFGLLERPTMPAIVMSEEGTDELALIENIQREDLHPIDEFEAVARLIEKHGYTQGDAARVLGKSRGSINELLSLGSLAAAILEEARVAGVSKSALVEIARAGDETAQFDLWTAVRAGRTTVREARAAKKGSPRAAGNPSPIGAVLRAGRRFAKAVAGLPDDRRFSEIQAAVDHLVSLLEQAS
jgi:ParB family chromosome partitioning protein